MVWNTLKRNVYRLSASTARTAMLAKKARMFALRAVTTPEAGAGFLRAVVATISNAVIRTAKAIATITLTKLVIYVII